MIGRAEANVHRYAQSSVRRRKSSKAGSSHTGEIQKTSAWASKSLEIERIEPKSREPDPETANGTTSLPTAGAEPTHHINRTSIDGVETYDMWIGRHSMTTYVFSHGMK